MAKNVRLKLRRTVLIDAIYDPGCTQHGTGGIATGLICNMRGLKTSLGRATAGLGWRLPSSRGKTRIRREGNWEGRGGK